MPTVTEREANQEQIDEQFDLIVAREFDAVPASVPLARLWYNKVLTQIAAGTEERQVSELVNGTELVSDEVIEQIAVANNERVTALVSRVCDTQKYDLLLTGSEFVTNAVRHATGQSEPETSPKVALPLDDLDALDVALNGNADVNEIILAEFKPNSKTAPKDSATGKFVAAVAVDTLHQMVSIITGDGNPKIGRGLTNRRPNDKAEGGRGLEIVKRVSASFDFVRGQDMGPLKEMTSFPLAKAAVANFTPVGNARVPRPRP